MDSSFFSGVLGFLQGALSFFVVLGIVVFVHEYGHFWVGRRCGVKVTDFSIGFGRALVQWRDRLGTQWKIGWLPLGGYVKFHGDANPASAGSACDASTDPEWAVSLHAKPVYQRALVVAAGPFANYLLAFFIFFFLAWFVGTPVDPVGSPKVTEVSKGYPAEAAGILAGDEIVAIDGNRVSSFADMQKMILSRGAVPISFSIKRGGQEEVVTITPILDQKLGIPVVGISHKIDQSALRFERLSPPQALVSAVETIWDISSQSLIFLSRMLTGQMGTQSLSGPLGIAELTAQAADHGIIPFLRMIALLSVSIGLINLFPIPLLDGGHLFFYAIEALRGRPLSLKVQEIGFSIGLFVVLGAMTFATWNDLSRFFTKWIGG